jgi:hypothetical protein
LASVLWNPEGERNSCDPILVRGYFGLVVCVFKKAILLEKIESFIVGFIAYITNESYSYKLL